MSRTIQLYSGAYADHGTGLAAALPGQARRDETVYPPSRHLSLSLSSVCSWSVRSCISRRGPRLSRLPTFITSTPISLSFTHSLAHSRALR